VGTILFPIHNKIVIIYMYIKHLWSYMPAFYVSLSNMFLRYF